MGPKCYSLTNAAWGGRPSCPLLPPLFTWRVFVDVTASAPCQTWAAHSSYPRFSVAKRQPLIAFHCGFVMKPKTSSSSSVCVAASSAFHQLLQKIICSMVLCIWHIELQLRWKKALRLSSY